MKITYEERRLKAVKEKYFFFAKVCTCCKSEIRKEKMWTVKVKIREGNQYYAGNIYFCKECTPTAKDVLEKIKNREIFCVDFP